MLTPRRLPLSPVLPSSLAFLTVENEAVEDGALEAAEWIRHCLGLTPRVERVDASHGLLDFGATSLPAAQHQMRHLLTRLAWQGIVARAGIGPTSTLAQLALLLAPHDVRLAVVTASQAPALLRPVPVQLLAQIHPSQPLLGPEVIGRLAGYGLHTLGHLARMEAGALRQQFGQQVGQALVALRQGQDLQPIQPTPLPHWHRVRLRWELPLDPHHAKHAVLALPRLVDRAGALLAGHAAGAVRVGVGWASGGRQVRQAILRQPSADAPVLQREAERLLYGLLVPGSSAGEAGDGEGELDDGVMEVMEGIEDVSLWLGACAAQQPTQATFWRTQQQRHAAVHAVAERLAHRHGRSLVLHAVQRSPATIFAEEGYTLLPTGTTGPADASAALGGGVPRSRMGRLMRSYLAAMDGWDEVPQHLHWW